jgi:hypothetical protein
MDKAAKKEKTPGATTHPQQKPAHQSSKDVQSSVQRTQPRKQFLVNPLEIVDQSEEIAQTKTDPQEDRPRQQKPLYFREDDQNVKKTNHNVIQTEIS